MHQGSRSRTTSQNLYGRDAGRTSKFPLKNCWCSSARSQIQRKATINVVVSVRLSVRMKQLGSHWTKFHKIWYFRIFRKYVTEIQISLNSDKNKGYSTWIPIYRVIQNDCRGFNNLSYTIHLRHEYIFAPMDQEILKVFFYDVRCAVVMHFSAWSAVY